MSSRKLADFIPAALPVVCAILMIAMALALADRFFASPPSLPEHTPGAAKLSPDVYATRIHYVAAAEFQAVAIAAALGFGFVLLLRLACDRESGWRFGFATAMVVLAAISSTLLIAPEKPSPLHALLKATVALQNFQIAFERATYMAAAVLVTVAALLRRQRDLWYLLMLGGVLLAGDVLLTLFAGRWAAAHFTGNARAGVDELVKGIVCGRAVFDALFLAATWIPARVNMNRCEAVQPA